MPKGIGYDMMERELMPKSMKNRHKKMVSSMLEDELNQKTKKKKRKSKY